jgi:hypothetical protein
VISEQKGLATAEHTTSNNKNPQTQKNKILKPTSNSSNEEEN